VKATLAYESHGAYIVSLASDPAEHVRIWDERMGRLYWPVPLSEIDLDSWQPVNGETEITEAVEVMESNQ
jgi:hypothetical protein